MPDLTLSSLPALAPFFGAKLLPNTDTVDYVDGPIHLSDTSEGLYYQPWRFRLMCNRSVSLAAATYVEQTVLSQQGIEKIAGSFDQNGRYLIGYIDCNKDLYIYWFDPNVNLYVSNFLDSDVDSMRMDLDDRRINQVGNSNVCIVYTKDNSLYTRIQIDRFAVGYLKYSDVQGKILKVGMNTANRFQILFEQITYPVYEDPYPAGTI